jgi:hypothetical protein
MVWNIHLRYKTKRTNFAIRNVTNIKNKRWISRDMLATTSKWSSGKDVILWHEMRPILIIQSRAKNIKWISRVRLSKTSKWSIAVKTTGCVIYHYGSSPTEVVLWFEMCRILIIKGKTKNIRWISCHRL